MSYTFTLSSYSSLLHADIYPPLELDIKEKYGLGLVGFYSYNSIFNVDETNNCFGYSKVQWKGPVLLKIPPGAYEISEIGAAMLKALQKGAKDLDDHIFSLNANNNTLKCEIESKYYLHFNHPNSIGKLLGFVQAERLKPNEIHISSSTVDITRVRIIRVDSNITAGAFFNSHQVHTLYEFDIDVEPGYKLSKEPNNIIYMPIHPDGRQFIDNITLSILDDNGQLINFQGEKVIVKLELKKIS